MKRSLGIIGLTLLSYCTSAQITITAADMPVAGDMLGYSNVDAATVTINPGDSGANVTWNYELFPTTQGMDVYRTPGEINPLLSFTLPGSELFGIKTLDSIPFIGLATPGVSITDIYTFYQQITIPSCFVASASSLTASGFPIGTHYTEPDVVYKFPLNYGDVDSNYYELTISLLTAGSLKRVGYRKNTVDGWGTISTPYYNSPTNCLRVRSEIFETDSITFNGTPFGIPNNSVEYKWLVNGDHYPALSVTTGGLLGQQTIRYRDVIPQVLATATATAPKPVAISAYPNPAPAGVFTLVLPSEWKTFHTDVYDMQSRLVVSQNNDAVINIQSLPAGNYLVRVVSGDKMAFVNVVK